MADQKMVQAYISVLNGVLTGQVMQIPGAGATTADGLARAYCHMLADLGSEAQAALPVLRKLAASSDFQIRGYAEEAIKKIES